MGCVLSFEGSAWIPTVLSTHGRFVCHTDAEIQETNVCTLEGNLSSDPIIWHGKQLMKVHSWILSVDHLVDVATCKVLKSSLWFMHGCSIAYHWFCAEQTYTMYFILCSRWSPLHLHNISAHTIMSKSHHVHSCCTPQHLQRRCCDFVTSDCSLRWYRLEWRLKPQKLGCNKMHTLLLKSWVRSSCSPKRKVTMQH